MRDLDRDNQALLYENRALNSTNQVLQREKLELQGKVRSLDQDNQILQDENKALESEKQELLDTAINLGLGLPGTHR